VLGVGELVEPSVDGVEDAFLADRGAAPVADVGVVGALPVAAVVRLAFHGGPVHRAATDRAADQAGEDVDAGLGPWRSSVRAVVVADPGVHPLPQLKVDERGPCGFVGGHP
jgi:hypothetical protein